MDHIRLQPMVEARELLRSYLRRENLSPGSRLPSERVLAEEWGRSRGTIRAAIRAEVEDGRLISRPGSGTFVAEPLVERNLQDLRPFAQIAEEAGYEVETELLAFSMPRASMELADRLDIDLGGEVHHIVRRRLFDGVPVAIEHASIPASLAPNMSAEVLAGRSLYEVLEVDYGVQVAGGYENVRLAPCPAEVAPLLDLEQDKAVFILEGVSNQADGSAVDSFESFVRGDYISFRSELSAN